MPEKSEIQLEFVCPKKWNGMIPEENGRFCHSCHKIVVDYSKSPIQNLQKPQEEGHCGSFYAYQLDRPFGNWKDQIVSRYQKILFGRNIFKPAILLFVACLLFLTGCYRRTTGVIAYGNKHKCNSEKHHKKF